jgi:hypothetical protein
MQISTGSDPGLRRRSAWVGVCQQLDFLGILRFRPDIVTEAALVIDRAEKQLDALLGVRIKAQTEPDHVVVFSGHMIDNPDNRGIGKGRPARFPPGKVDAAAASIRKALDRIGAGSGDLGLCAAPQAAICCSPRLVSSAACGLNCASLAPNRSSSPNR